MSSASVEIHVQAIGKDDRLYIISLPYSTATRRNVKLELAKRAGLEYTELKLSLPPVVTRRSNKQQELCGITDDSDVRTGFHSGSLDSPLALTLEISRTPSRAFSQDPEAAFPELAGAIKSVADPIATMTSVDMLPTSEYQRYTQALGSLLTHLAKVATLNADYYYFRAQIQAMAATIDRLRTKTLELNRPSKMKASVLDLLADHLPKEVASLVFQYATEYSIVDFLLRNKFPNYPPSVSFDEQMLVLSTSILYDIPYRGGGNRTLHISSFQHQLWL
eukprot:gb/GEZN01006222.1/.p1 GENE.gb/GEZN01006222.1/~~gb/GEZN01006222.1/.p1  ORF type:complete len:277 (-),score=29.53 gb/GEZN01006222.1/:698-1528(-)